MFAAFHVAGTVSVQVALILNTDLKDGIIKSSANLFNGKLNIEKRVECWIYKWNKKHIVECITQNYIKN